MSRANALSFRLFRTLTSYHYRNRAKLITVGPSGIWTETINARKIGATDNLFPFKFLYINSLQS